MLVDGATSVHTPNWASRSSQHILKEVDRRSRDRIHGYGKRYIHGRLEHGRYNEQRFLFAFARWQE